MRLGGTLALASTQFCRVLPEIEILWIEKLTALIFLSPKPSVTAYMKISIGVRLRGVAGSFGTRLHGLIYMGRIESRRNCLNVARKLVQMGPVNGSYATQRYPCG